MDGAAGCTTWLFIPASAGGGIARDLVKRLEASLREMGCPKVNLIVWSENEEAMRFWEALGYRREAAVEYGKELT